jgi:hypothetical protein
MSPMLSLTALRSLTLHGFSLAVVTLSMLVALPLDHLDLLGSHLRPLSDERDEPSASVWIDKV